MALPDFNQSGDLPTGVHRAAVEEVAARFGRGFGKRRLVTQRLLHIYDLAKRTQHLQRFVLFGSYITDKPEPRDVDVTVVMDGHSQLDDCPAESSGLFDHALAQARYGASIFWTRPNTLLNNSAKVLRD